MKISKNFTTVTTLSKYAALALFVILPFLTFWIGMNYQKKYILENFICIQMSDKMKQFNKKTLYELSPTQPAKK